MSKEMIISVNGREKKIAILDNGRVSEFYIERGEEENSGIVGNIYKGRVQRVLPGMQSAFVGIGLERDAFLYVSDFFDEEEEIERIVMEKSKQSAPEVAEREATDQIQRARLEREKQMEAVQDIAEPIAETETAIEAAISSENEAPENKADEKFQSKGGRDNQRRGRNDQERQTGKVQWNKRDFSDETIDPQKEITGSEEAIAEREEEARETELQETELPFDSAPIFEWEDSSFERIVDDEDTGDSFKDAYIQEAITDKVRAIEFNMEGAATAEVGSLIGSVSDEPNGFERIADEDEKPDETQKPKSKRGNRGGKNRNKTSSEKTGQSKSDETVESKISNSDNTDGENSGEQSQTAADTSGENAADENPETKPTGKAKPAKSSKKNRGNKKPAKNDQLENAEASVKESNDTAEMAVRRGGRGRRRVGEQTERPPRADSASDDKEKPEDSASQSNFRSNDNYRGGNGGGRGRNNRERAPQPTITDLLREGQDILVQIAKEPIAKKGARITSHIALPGRFLVYMPTIEHLGVSRKIESASERSRLRVLIQKIKQEEEMPSGGFIVRTAGIGISDEDLRQDARYLIRTWLDIKKTAEKAKSPALVHQDLDIIERLLRDQLSDDFTAIRVDSEEEYLRIVEFINRIQPRMVNRVKLYTREEPILEKYGVQEEIDKALKPRVWLKSGGYLVINQTEALVAIDVNTGKFVGRGNARLEDTITKTNMEAVEEIARQIRLRDLGGIIVLDLIDMEDRRNRNKVAQALQEALASDKSPNKVLSFNDFGLIIMTRKRVKQSLERTMCAPCDYCEGAGWVKSPQTICFEILDEARRLSKSVDDVRQTTLRVHPDVAKSLHETERLVFEEIEAYLGNVDITGDKSIHQEQFDFAFI
jgi:ribonuclease G